MTNRHTDEQRSRTERSRFEDLAAAISACLIRTPDEELGRSVEDVLARIGGLFAVDRVTVWEYREAPTRLVQLSFWEAPGVRLEFPDMACADFPWIVGRLLDRQAVELSCGEDPAPEAAADVEAFERLGIRSFVALPLEICEALGGALSLCSLSAEKSQPIPRRRLSLVADSIAAALARRKIRNELHLSERAPATSSPIAVRRSGAWSSATRCPSTCRKRS